MRWVQKHDHFIFQVKINFSQKQKKMPTSDLSRPNRSNVWYIIPHDTNQTNDFKPGSTIYRARHGDCKDSSKNYVTQIRGGSRSFYITWMGWSHFWREQEGLRVVVLKDVTFTRCLKPIDAIDDPVSNVFPDASTQAYKGHMRIYGGSVTRDDMKQALLQQSTG